MDERIIDERIMEMSKLILEGYGMSVPRLGEAYTLTIRCIAIENKAMDELNFLGDNPEGRERQAILLNREISHVWRTSRFTHTFSKVTALEDTGTPFGGNGVIKIRGISPKINGMYVEAEISYPNSYTPPIVA